MDKLILASGSPRRQEILSQIGISYTVRPQDVDESFAGLSADEEAVRLSEKKVRACLRTEQAASDWVLGADTFIEFRGNFLGKPRNREDARLTLSRLSGLTHTVITGLALNVPRAEESSKPLIQTAVCRTDVTFAVLGEDEIEWYLDTGEWEGAAAAYRIQEKGAVFIDSITGSYTNVMGLPINTIYGMLRANNFNFRT